MDNIGRLVSLSGSGVSPSDVMLFGPLQTIGRSKTNSIVLRDRSVSKRHAEITLARDGRFWLSDLGSSNGTHVNGDRVEHHELTEGDEIKLGGCRFRYTEQAPASRVHLADANPVSCTSILATTAVESSVAGDSIDDLETMRRVYHRVRTALDAVRRMVATTDPEKLGQQILDVTFELLNVDAGAVLLLGDEGTPVPVAFRVPDTPDSEVVVSRPLVDQVAQTQCAVLATDTLMDRHCTGEESTVCSRMRSIICVPLVYEGAVYAVVHISNASRATAFDKDDLALLSGICEGAAVALAHAITTQCLEEERRKRAVLGRFLSPLTLNRIMRGPSELLRGGDKALVTVMFVDIRGFTQLTEQSAPDDVVDMLNAYFDVTVEAIFSHEGMLDKYIGDAVMAIWGTPETKTDDASRAVEAAQTIFCDLKKLNHERQLVDRPPIGVGIGLATGSCVAGAMGAKQRLEYTVIGDAVNVASRLSGIAEPNQILCDQETQSRICASSTRLPLTTVKGKKKQMTIYSVDV